MSSYSGDKMKSGFAGKMISAILLGFGAIAMSGCVGGTTFGTGVSQERQLLNDLEGMISFGAKKRKKNINYAARPDLVMPAKTAALPNPLEQESSTSNVDWPETPEQKLARIRAEAGEIDPRSGAVSQQELRRKKTGIRVSRGKIEIPEMDRDGHPTVSTLQKKEAIRAKYLKEKYAFSKGPARKYLTEPPVEYRKPIDTALSGDQGISEEELRKREAKAAKIKRQNDLGMWTN